jgi:hypothetical protein
VSGACVLSRQQSRMHPSCTAQQRHDTIAI